MSPPITGCLTSRRTPRSPSWPGWPRSAGGWTDYRELKTGLGLGHFEGRAFTGWHRHVTLAVLAQAFCTMIRQDPKSPCAGMTLYQVLRELQLVLALILGACPLCRQPVTPDQLAVALAAT